MNRRQFLKQFTLVASGLASGLAVAEKKYFFFGNVRKIPVGAEGQILRADYGRFRWEPVYKHPDSGLMELITDLDRIHLDKFYYDVSEASRREFLRTGTKDLYLYDATV